MTRRVVTTLVAALLTLGGLLLVPGTASAVVSSTPPATPQIGGSNTSGTDGTIEVVRQIKQCGSVMYAVGSFTQVRNPNSTTPIARSNAFAFRATSPYTVLPWAPNPNGPVDTVACAPDGDILLGGSFTSAGGAAVRNLTKVDEVSGLKAASFALQPSGRVAHVEVVTPAGGVPHLLVGRYAGPYLRSVNPVTGASDGYAVPAFAGTYQYDMAVAQTPRVYNMTVSPDGQAVLMTGIFTSVGGQHHEQVVRLNLTTTGAQVSAWSPTELYQHCFYKQPFYAQDAAWSQNGQQIIVVTTGYRLQSEWLLPSTQRPQTRTGPCDAAIGYPTAQQEFAGHSWINYTGCDSLYAVATDATTAYIAGHQRWISNGNECDRNNSAPGRAQSGLGELNPATGADVPGPSRGRGLGANDLLVTSAGLWIGSDNQANTSGCGTATTGRMGICFLPN